MAVADTRDLPYEKTLRHVHDFLEIAGLEKKKECLISNLSYGEKRALCLLQLLLGNPETLVLTSPLAGLTPREAQKIRDLIAYFGETHTVFLCTSSTRDLSEMCDEILILQNHTFKTVVATADEETLKVEFSTASPCNVSSSPKTETKTPSSNRAHTVWKLLMQKSEEYEVIDGEEKEDDN
jgi:ABC-type multidrug transport system ATPase subunit